MIRITGYIWTVLNEIIEWHRFVNSLAINAVHDINAIEITGKDDGFHKNVSSTDAEKLFCHLPDISIVSKTG